jgi:hypothetical protein
LEVWLVWDIEFTEQFSKWWNGLKEEEQITVDASVRLLEHFGPNLRFPYSSGIAGSKFGQMRELRIQHQGKPYRVLYVFDPRRVALLLLGGNKQGKNNWYKKFVPIAEQLYEQHIKSLKGKNNG